MEPSMCGYRCVATVSGLIHEFKPLAPSLPQCFIFLSCATPPLPSLRLCLSLLPFFFFFFFSRSCKTVKTKQKKKHICLYFSNRKETSPKTGRLPYSQDDWQILVAFSKKSNRTLTSSQASRWQPRSAWKWVQSYPNSYLDNCSYERSAN